jgi:hypothetical protein
MKLGQAQQGLFRARTELGRWAADTYKVGDLATLSLLFSDDPDRYVQTNGTLVSLADQRAGAVDDLQQQRRLVVASTTDVQEQQQRLQHSRGDLGAAKREIERKLAQAEHELGRLTGDQRSQLAEEDEKDNRQVLQASGVKLPMTGRPTCNDVPLGPSTAESPR